MKCPDKGAIAAVASACLVLASHAAVAADQGVDLSIWGGRMSGAGHGRIPYVADLNFTPASIADQDIGKGTSFGIGLGVKLNKDWALDFGYARHRPKATGTFDTDPAEPNDCNVRPVQGLVSDCYDTSIIRIATKLQALDAAIGKRLMMRATSVFLYGGLRYLRYDQTIDTAYLYPGGFEEFSSRKAKYSGLGPRVGARATVPLGDSGFFLNGDVSIAKMLTGKRKQDIQADETSSGSPFSSRAAAETIRVRPLTFDLNLQLGYRVTEAVQLAAGWRYQRVDDILDTRDTNDPAVAGTLPGSRGLGAAKDPFIVKGFFVELGARM